MDEHGSFTVRGGILDVLSARRSRAGPHRVRRRHGRDAAALRPFHAAFHGRDRPASRSFPSASGSTRNEEIRTGSGTGVSLRGFPRGEPGRSGSSSRSTRRRMELAKAVRTQLDASYGDAVGARPRRRARAGRRLCRDRDAGPRLTPGTAPGGTLAIDAPPDGEAPAPADRIPPRLVAGGAGVPRPRHRLGSRDTTGA